MFERLEDYSRRRFLGDATTGLMGVGLSHLLGREMLFAQKSGGPAWKPGAGMTHLAAQSKASLADFLSRSGLPYGFMGA